MCQYRYYDTLQTFRFEQTEVPVPRPGYCCFSSSLSQYTGWTESHLRTLHSYVIHCITNSCSRQAIGKIILFILVAICCRLVYVWRQKSHIEMRGAFRRVFTFNTWWNLKRVENLGYRTKQWHSGELKAQ